MTSCSGQTLTDVQDIVASQWVWREELQNALTTALGTSAREARATLLLYRVDRVRPLLWEMHGTHEVVRHREGKECVQDIIKLQLGDDQNSFSDSAHSAAHYSNIGFSIPSLLEWIKQSQLSVSLPELTQWMTKNGNFLESRGLLEKPAAEMDSESTKAGRPVGLLSYDDLLIASGYTTKTSLIAWLESNDIPYKTGVRNRPFTTLQAVNQVLGVGEEVVPANRVISL